MTIDKKFKDLNSSAKILVYLKKMLSHCWKHRNKTESKNRKVAKSKIGRIMSLLKCAAWIVKN